MIEKLKQRISQLGAAMIEMNDELGALTARARQVEAALLETRGQRAEAMFWLNQIAESEKAPGNTAPAVSDSQRGPTGLPTP